ncbi:hypothetical protein M758_1G243400 [Ceratodon purpureus]|nr:hypothetical protein M758_1G243400 [Ceratodon purpureus]
MPLCRTSTSCSPMHHDTCISHHHIGTSDEKKIDVRMRILVHVVARTLKTLDLGDVCGTGQFDWLLQSIVDVLRIEHSSHRNKEP